MTSQVQKTSNQLDIYIPVNPVPASRPRVTRWGVYYGKKYTAWRKDVEAHFKANPLLVPSKFTQPVLVEINHVVLKPKTSKLSFPKPDLDNYDKAVLDAITSYTEAWEDDYLVRKKYTHKQFADENLSPGTYITIKDY